MTEFTEGKNIINNMPIKLLIYKSPPYVLYNNKKFIKMKYEGYESFNNYMYMSKYKKIYN